MSATSCQDDTGFTLIEVLITASLIAIVSLGIYGLFDSGIRVMKKVSRPVSEERIHFFLEKFSHDVQNLFSYTGVPFRGENHVASFATIIQTEPQLGGDQGIGQVTYVYDEKDRTIYRKQLNVSQFYEAKEDGEENDFDGATEILNQVISCQFQYYNKNLSDEGYSWEDSWNQLEQNKGLPVAVKIDFSFMDEGEQQNVSRTITIPVSNK